MAREILAAVVAGGASSRMGRDKATVTIGSAAMIDHVIEAASKVTADVVVVGRTSGPPGVPVVADDMPARRGPLAGLATALRIAAGHSVLLLAVDQPYVRPETLHGLAALSDGMNAVVPIDGGRRQVTCAVYPASWAEDAAAEVRRDGTIQSLIDRLGAHEVAESVWRSWGEDGRSWASVDTPHDARKTEERWGSPP